jgi:alkylation response protein AidB-like acyl-CoA dehydrogenase
MDENEFVERCAALAPELAAGAADGERQRRVPDRVLARIEDTDVLRAIVPPSLCGHGLGLRALCDGTRALANGCPATAWTASFLMLHAWMLGRFPAVGRAELFANGRIPTAAAPLAPTGTLTPTNGGYRVAGNWEWATAIAHSDWCIVHGLDTSVDLGTRFAALPVAEVTVEDRWFTSGMRATGSNVVVVDDVFVPAHRTVAGDQLRGRGSGVPDDQLANLPLLSVLALTASAPAVGAAEAATEHFVDRTRRRVLAYSLGDRAADQPLTQARLASIASALTTMRAGWFAAIDELERVAATTAPDELLRVRTRLAAAAAVRASRSIIGDVGEGAGASVYATSHPIQRLQRDVETLKGHVVFDWDRTTELAGRVMLGHPLRPTDLA